MGVQEIVKEIQELINPLNGESVTFQEALRNKLAKFDLTKLENLRTFSTDNNDIAKVLPKELKENPWWQFINLLLENLILLKNTVMGSDEKDSLLSIGQQKTVKSSLEILICTGIVPCLNPGIGIPLSQRTTSELFIDSCHFLLNERYHVLNYTVNGILNLFEEEFFRAVLLGNYLVDILAALCQLIMDKQAQDMDFCKKQLRQLIVNSYQPSVIRALMILLGNKDVPKKLSRWLSDSLSERLLENGGLVATLRAILDLTGGAEDSPRHWDHVAALARLIAAPRHSSVHPQVLSLVKDGPSDYRRVAVLAVHLIYEAHPQDSLLRPILAPLTVPPTSESSIHASLSFLHACSSSSLPRSYSPPPTLFSEVYPHLLRLHVMLAPSVSHLKSIVAAIAWEIISRETDIETLLERVFFEKINVKFCFGSEGGVYTEEGENTFDPEALAECILDLTRINDDVSVKRKFFNALIASSLTNRRLERKFIDIKFLSELCGEADVQKFISENPSSILPFIKSLLVNSQDYDIDTICLGLMVLGTVLDGPKTTDWNQFLCLVEPLKKFKSENCEVNTLVEELYQMILTHGVIRSKPKNVVVEKTSLETALEEACDPLLPVRAHGIKELGKLILAKDKEAINKKAAIFCIFKENLTNEDSYLYLSCIEGLAMLGASFPDEVLTILVEELTGPRQDTEVKLKVGEVLLKTARLLNEMAVVYKRELVGCLLWGCRQEDPLLRASSLSNLGELAHILSFRINSQLPEILECVRNVIETDRCVEPRRAAVMVITLLLRGLGQDALQCLESVLLDLYRGLREIYLSDKDEITRLHAQLALEELRASTIAFLRPSALQSFQKRIFVLDPPT